MFDVDEGYILVFAGYGCLVDGFSEGSNESSVILFQNPFIHSRYIVDELILFLLFKKTTTTQLLRNTAPTQLARSPIPSLQHQET